MGLEPSDEGVMENATNHLVSFMAYLSSRIDAADRRANFAIIAIVGVLVFSFGDDFKSMGETPWIRNLENILRPSFFVLSISGFVALIALFPLNFVSSTWPGGIFMKGKVFSREAFDRISDNEKAVLDMIEFQGELSSLIKRKNRLSACAIIGLIIGVALYFFGV